MVSEDRGERRPFRPTLVPLVVVLGLVLAAGGSLGLAWLLRSEAPPSSGRLEAAGVEGVVRIYRDRLGVPHVRASSEADAYFGLGFAHAADRLWQLEVLRRAARGDLSEVFGEATLPADRLARTLGLGRAADEEAKSLPRRYAANLAAYSAGVNRWIDRLREGRVWPVELRWLAFEPRPWTPADTLAVIRLRGWMFGRSLGASLLLERLKEELGGVVSQEFFPSRSVRGGHLSRGSGKGDGDPDLLVPLARAGDALAGVVGLRGPAGSGGFVVGRSRARGGPILANDPHVEFRLPALFYVAHLQTPDWEVAGGTWPGVPVFWTATNRDVAWGQVALHASTSELFEEAIDADTGQYQRGDRWLEPEVRHERIRVRHGDDVEFDVTLTRHGPLVDGVAPEGFALAPTPEGVVRGIALQWTGDGDESGVVGLLKLQHASNWPEFRLALRAIPAPAATYLYADRGGAIGMQVAGRLPVRWIDTGLLPVPGSSGYYDWRGFVPFDALPSEHGEDVPWLIASSRPPDDQFETPMAWLWSRGGAETRLREVLESDAPLGLDEVLALQRERHSDGGARFVSQVLDGVEPSSERARRVYRDLREWDGDTSAGSTGAAVYHVFRENLVARALRERLGDELAGALRSVGEPVPGAALAEFLERTGPQTERRLAEAALEDTWSWLQANVDPNPARWSWGAVQRLRLRHDFERLGSGPLWWFGRTLGRGPFAVAGDADSLWTMYTAGAAPFDPRVGPAFRFVADLSMGTHAAFGLAGGQSGSAGDPHYDDALADWLDGRGRPLWMHASDVAYHGYDVWEVHPPPEVPAASE